VRKAGPAGLGESIDQRQLGSNDASRRESPARAKAGSDRVGGKRQQLQSQEGLGVRRRCGPARGRVRIGTRPGASQSTDVAAFPPCAGELDPFPDAPLRSLPKKGVELPGNAGRSLDTPRASIRGSARSSDTALPLVALERGRQMLCGQGVIKKKGESWSGSLTGEGGP